MESDKVILAFSFIWHSVILCLWGFSGNIKPKRESFESLFFKAFWADVLPQCGFAKWVAAMRPGTLKLVVEAIGPCYTPTGFLAKVDARSESWFI